MGEIMVQIENPDYISIGTVVDRVAKVKYFMYPLL